ncbi:atrial natriuretic peptide receptor 1-like isoform X2 [Haliotis rufescens]|uniref:atrial natriuretic peptide receptor 1-like isoform X2 n=1 Tax=Haliotis rufescens TaxID=6454 RepID=UPI00201F3E68|nr:atrial natriuretic peptide receptor 1-like isoform X2 [Haliotis rufescens]
MDVHLVVIAFMVYLFHFLAYVDGTKTLNIACLLPADDKRLFSISRVAPALEIVVNSELIKHQVLPFHKIGISYADSQCSISHGMNEAINVFVDGHVDVYFGPCCDYAAAPVARQLRYWNIPMVTAGAMARDFALSKLFQFPLMTRVGPNFNSLVSFIISILQKFDWSRVKLVYDPLGQAHVVDKFCHIATDGVHYGLRMQKVIKDFKQEYFKFDSIKDILNKMAVEVGNEFSIVVLCASPDSVRDIMIHAHDLNFDNGEYVFFNIDLFSSKNESEASWYREDDPPERNEKARKAYEALMTVTLRKPTSPAYRKFSEEVKRRAQVMYPDFTYGEEEVNSFVGAFHDAVILYALALNETIQAGGKISDGANITRRMWNRTFEGITGTVSIDANGDRNADYSLLDMNPDSGKFEVVANYFGNKKRYEPVPGKEIHWAGGRTSPPPDVPKCGFDGAKCPPEEPFPEYGIVIIVLGSVLLIVLVATFFIYRHIKLEAELAEMNWRVKWDDILFGSPGKNKKLDRSGKGKNAERVSFSSSCSRDTIAVLNNVGNRQLFTKTGYYKGAIIAIKPISRSSITIHKPLLLEVKTIKDLQNDHVVRFIGACLDSPHQCILTEYCPKGSLQDVLENDEIQLDWMFRYSIMQDIVRGMAYLHSSEAKSHGRLKSTNCVVDSRFVVKITDFGLHYFRETDDDFDEMDFALQQSRLWSGPELLKQQNVPCEGTQKGDVYSFAVICQEIVYRKGVFYLQHIDLSPQEICQKVKTGVKPYFRPTLEDYDCPCDELADVIRRCWAEDPMERPDFQALKSIIRKLNKDGDKGNILDNLLSRMEQYANNLEALVAERTSDYLEEKRKAEDLLYSMLPKSVAGQLIRGESVTAEAFECVTIYFSDIVGFTAMSAESTPMQIVDFLNDLYTTFDSIIENFDVYKVETIGDAYMVVSGMPVPNGNVHAREIARMSLALLNAIKHFRIRHRPEEHLKLRIGIHTGGVCAGVVGLKMPRYCLFGDTVNTTSRMESNGLPLKIHLSQQTKDVLDHFRTFDVELRGQVEMKGKGAQTTYWLVGETPTSATS